ncbi:MAG: hypothetical protein Q8P86_00145 [bacterium]|nr:hypothetical protein [bacterium]
MEPMSKKRRFVYLSLCWAFFFALLPLVSLYASGYRLGEGFSITRTGGIYIHARTMGAVLSIDGSPVKTLGALDRGFFVQNLKPKIYEIEVAKEGFVTWKKKVFVEEGIVTENSSSLYPDRITLRDIPKIITENSKGQSRENPEYIKLIALFEEKENDSTEPEVSKEKFSANFPLQSGDVSIWQENGEVIARFKDRDMSNIPYFFCSYGECKSEISVFSISGVVKHADFYPGKSDTVIFTLPEGVYIVGLDITSPQFTMPLYEGEDADFRVDNGLIYLKDKDVISRVEM